MRPVILLLVMTVFATAENAFCQEQRNDKSDIDFERLATTEGDVFFDVRIRDVEPDSLIIEHRNGAARVSLFNLPDEIRINYDFDAERAMAHYKARDERLRALRKQQVQEKLRVDAEMAAAARREAHDEDVRRNWIPARARIIEFVADGALAYVDRITMERRPTRTALGGEGLPGPPQASYSRLAASPVILKGLRKGRGGLQAGSTWTGYVMRDAQDAALDQRDPDAPLVFRATVLSQ